MTESRISDNRSDGQLALRSRAGCRASFEELVRRYRFRLYYYLRSRIASDQDAEDLVQETFLKAYRAIGRFNGRYEFSTWVYTIAQRLLISQYRRRSLRPADTPLPVSADPQDEYMRREDLATLWQRARALPADQFQALWLRYAEGMSPKEVAAVMKKSRVHVRVLLHRARTRLVEAMTEMGCGEESEECSAN